MIWYICQLQLGWHPVAVVQYTFTHKQYIEQHNQQQNNKNNKKKTQIINLEECWPCPVFASFTLAFALQLRKKHKKTSVRLAEEIQSIHIIKTSTHVVWTSNISKYEHK
jgi:hypothetical protein